MGAFRFKQFEVMQEHSAMKVNTDAVLLGAWASVPGTENVHVLDIGTGTGVIALMVGQRIATGTDVRTEAPAGCIHAVEIDSGACEDAAANFGAAPWKGISFHLHGKSLQEFASNEAKDSGMKFNLIVSNPPYFISSLKNSSENKTLARHTDTLSQRELLFHSTALLSEGGIFAVILPVTEGEELLRKVEFMAQAAVNATSCQQVLFPSRICYIHTVEHKPAKRLMLEFIKCHPSARPVLQREQLVMMCKGSYTLEYSSLVGKFYL